jgi:hypothetical protein
MNKDAGEGELDAHFFFTFDWESSFIYEKSSFYFRKFVELGPYLSTFLKFEGLYDNFMKSGATIYWFKYFFSQKNYSYIYFQNILHQFWNTPDRTPLW